MTLNIIIPVLNEEETILGKIAEAVEYLNKTELRGQYRITIIDNGSDDSTPILGKKLEKEYQNLVYYIRLDKRGVGLAVRTGIMDNPCDIIGYMDLDLATDLKHLRQVYWAFEKRNKSIVVGSRLLKGSKVIGRSMVRSITSIGLNTILKLYLRVGFSDAMCGFKFYRKDIAECLVRACSDTDGWFYCAEMLIRAEWMDIKISEIPIIWTDTADSKVKIGKLSMSYLKEIRKLHKEKLRYKKGRKKK